MMMLTACGWSGCVRHLATSARHAARAGRHTVRQLDAVVGRCDGCAAAGGD